MTEMSCKLFTGNIVFQLLMVTVIVYITLRVSCSKGTDGTNNESLVSEGDVLMCGLCDTYVHTNL